MVIATNLKFPSASIYRQIYEKKEESSIQGQRAFVEAEQLNNE